MNVTFDENALSPEDELSSGTIAACLEKAELWSQLRYDAASTHRGLGVRDSSFSIELALHDRQDEDDDALLATRRASHKIYNGFTPREAKAPPDVPTCNLQVLSMTSSFARDPSHGSGKKTRSSNSRNDSGIGLNKDINPAPEDIEMLDLFEEDQVDLFDDSDIQADKDDWLFDELEINGINHLEPTVKPGLDEGPRALSTQTVISCLDAALRTVLCPRLTKADAAIKVKKGADSVRLDEIAPAACKPAALRALAMQSVFSSTICNVLDKHKMNNLGLLPQTDTRDQGGNEGRENEKSLWYLMFKKLLKDAPGVRLAPLKIEHGGDVLEDDSGKDLFEDMDDGEFETVREEEDDILLDVEGGMKSEGNDIRDMLDMFDEDQDLFDAGLYAPG
ncbi:Hypothetical protein D9617_12g035640 [Elsinoe fawcettii]|nr:Hypothetical protein D9617_12g035640 [Elsinoe fawcettii]